jgi:hypothetical protein
MSRKKKLKTARLDVRISPNLKKKFNQSIKTINKYLMADAQTDKSFWICYFIDVFTDFEEKVRHTALVKEMRKNNIKLPADGFFPFLNQAYTKEVGKAGVKGIPDIKKIIKRKEKAKIKTKVKKKIKKKRKKK